MANVTDIKLPRWPLEAAQKPLKRGAKVDWIPTSVRLPPDLKDFLHADAESENVDVTFVIVEVLQQYRAFKTAKKKGKR